MDTLFDYNFDRKLKCWIAWDDCIDPYMHNASLNLDEMIVSTKDSSRMVWMLKIINHVCTYIMKY